MVLVSFSVMRSLFDYSFHLLLQYVGNTATLLNHVVFEISIRSIYIYGFIFPHHFLCLSLL